MAYIRVEVDEDEILSEIDTDDLIEELESRSDLPPKYKAVFNSNQWEKTPTRNAMCYVLGLAVTSSIEDIIQGIKENYYK